MGVRKVCVCFVLFLTVCAVEAQIDHKEQLHVLTSSNDLLSGQSLHFQAQVSSLETGRKSQLSSLLYVELLNDANEALWQAKVLLDEGYGEGSYYIPSITPTGTYHLVAYTRWMKNFGEFFHEPILVTNPYIKLDQKFTAPEETSVSFFPEGGKLVKGYRNHVVVQFKNKDGHYPKTARIVSDQGDTREFQVDENGLGSFYINPNGSAKYQLIFSEDSELHFVAIPDVCEDCEGMALEERGGEYSVSVHEKKENADYSIVVLGTSGEVLRRMVTANSTVRFHREDLPNGPYVIQLMRAQVVQAERVFWNGTPVPIDSSHVGTYGRGEWIESSVIAPGATSAFFAIRRRSDANGTNTCRLQGKLRRLLSGFYLKSHRPVFQSLDKYMVASNWPASWQPVEEVALLPEFRNDLMQGLVTDKDDLPVEGATVGLAIPASGDQVRVTRTDSSGLFQLDVDIEHSANAGTFTGVLSLFEPGQEMTATSKKSTIPTRAWSEHEQIGELDGRNVLMLDEFYSHFPILPTVPYAYDSIRIAGIVTRSINSQIENAFYLPEPRKASGVEPWFEGFKSYLLDDYQRFPTLRDSFIEYIPEVNVSKSEQKFKLRVGAVDQGPSGKSLDPPLLLLDGGFVSSQHLLETSPYLIERIDVLPRKYVFGDIVFEGVIALHSTAGDLWRHKGVLLQDFTPVVSQVSDSWINEERDTRIPDRRELLLWGTKDVDSGGQLSLTCKTPETGGLFELEVIGFSEQGEVQQFIRTFYVE